MCGRGTPARLPGARAGRHRCPASYHWLDPLGNAIVWDGPRTAFERPVEPGAEVEVELELRAPQPPGRYRLAIDLVEELRYWFAEVGSSPLELDVEVLPRIAERRLGVVVHGGADEGTAAHLAAQEEPPVETDAAAVAHLVAGALPAPDWTSRILDAHAEGFAAVGGSVETRDRALRPWAPGRGPQPRVPASAALPVAPRRTGAVRARGPPRLRAGRRAVDLRRADQTSTATRSSTRLKTYAPTASATTAETAR